MNLKSLKIKTFLIYSTLFFTSSCIYAQSFNSVVPYIEKSSVTVNGVEQDWSNYNLTIYKQNRLKSESATISNFGFNIEGRDGVYDTSAFIEINKEFKKDFSANLVIEKTLTDNNFKPNFSYTASIEKKKTDVLTYGAKFKHLNFDIYDSDTYVLTPYIKINNGDDEYNFYYHYGYNDLNGHNVRVLQFSTVKFFNNKKINFNYANGDYIYDAIGINSVGDGSGWQSNINLSKKINNSEDWLSIGFGTGKEGDEFSQKSINVYFIHKLE